MSVLELCMTGIDKNEFEVVQSTLHIILNAGDRLRCELRASTSPKAAMMHVLKDCKACPCVCVCRYYDRVVAQEALLEQKLSEENDEDEEITPEQIWMVGFKQRLSVPSHIFIVNNLLLIKCAWEAACSRCIRQP